MSTTDGKAKANKDRRMLSSLGFSLLILVLGGVFGYLKPGFDVSTLNLFPHFVTVAYLSGPVVCMMYYFMQTMPLAVGEVGSITAVADDGILSVMPLLAIIVILLLWAVMPEFKISVFFFGQLMFATLVVIMDIFLNGRIGATVNRLVQEYKQQR